MSVPTETPVSPSRRHRSALNRTARFGLAALAAMSLTLGGVVAGANAAPGAVLVSGGPTLTVSKVSSVNNTDVLTISGSGFDASTVSPATGAVAGFYLSIGSVDTTNGWRPSLAKPSTSRSATQTVWVHPGGTGSGEANLSNTGTFSTTVTVASQYTKASGFTWAVFTIGAHGVANAAQEQAIEIGYTGSTTAPPAPGSGTPALSTSYDPVAETIYVSGTGYGGAGATGVYASVGVINTSTGWKPSAGKGSSTRSASDTFWVWSGGPSTPAAGQAKLTSGTFAVTLDTSSLPALPSGFSYAVYTIGAHGAVNSAVEQATVFTP
ncbi:hypothetical protein MN032_07320 [Agromyces atrinae]|uniref:hypothetical protein n=1 Tax=Agromyces atrinae TaxID=592376 RepID=UPI001F5A9916|nr:hypothetical protein [Agromyces atrinae]MCI2957495.1 hypothetical protein [Agromyces atrinae]